MAKQYSINALKFSLTGDPSQTSFSCSIYSGTDEKCLIQTLCSKSNDEIAAIKEEYTYEIKRDLQDDLQVTTNFLRQLGEAIDSEMTLNFMSSS